MLTLKIKELEKRLDIRLKRNKTTLGVDTATKTGWCLVKTDNDTVNIDYGFIHFSSKDMFFRYDKMIDFFRNLITTKLVGQASPSVVIEDIFFGKNVNTLKVLARYGMIVYLYAYENRITKSFILATQARKKLGFSGNMKKELLQEAFLKKAKLRINDNDVIDAMILGLSDHIEDSQNKLNL